MNILSNEKKSLVLSLLSEGNSIRSTERMTGVHRDTIMRLMVAVGRQARIVLNAEMKNLTVKKLQVDEIWTYVGKKQKQLTEDDKEEYGDQYVFVALDADTKLIPAFKVGKRNGINATSFMMELKGRIVTRFQLSTDCFSAYPEAVDQVFGADIDFGTIHKVYRAEPGKDSEYRYSPANIIRIDKQSISGDPNWKDVSTSYIERQNLTMRMSMRRFTRLTNAYSKKLENLEAALNLYFWHYNFARVHEALRCTPAMEAGLTRHIWTWNDLLNYNREAKAA